ncbi:hypothetical protein [Aliiroseovarius sp. YM-037]|uniref:hypothetical protein n=1 Tax=Aliiroseovarius sp. YM-037 TaxID=3341728 RepID=UPI003A80E5B7
MTFKTRILLFLVHTVARIQGVFLGVKRLIKRASGNDTKPAGPERYLILNDGDPIIEFMHVAIFSDRIIEQYGIVGHQAPRETHPISLRDNIMDRVEELMEEGYIPVADFPRTARLTLSGPITDDAEHDIVRELGDYLADRGLGLVTETAASGGTLTLTLDVTQADLARPLIGEFLKRDAYADYALAG